MTKKILISAVVIVIVIVIVLLKTNQVNAPAQQPKNQQTTNYSLPTTTLFFAGDIMLSRNVAAETLKTGDFAYPFGKVGEEVKNFDLSFANLESPFMDKGPYAQQGLVFKIQPEAVWGLTFAGFDVLSTANNHALDQGKKGIEFTLKHLRDNNILPIGTGQDCHSGQIIQGSTLKFGFLAYSYTGLNDGGKTTSPQVCDANNLELVSKDIKALKEKSDFLIVSMHMGTEYQRQPNQSQIDFAHAAIDAGAFLVIGHHPHWIQTIEQYKGNYIFYSLGNFVFDQMWSQDTKEGLTVTITITNNKISKIELQPVIIEDYCCPRWATNEEILSILKKIGLTSSILVDNN